LKALYDTFDDSGVIDLSQWTQAHIELLPTAIGRDFPEGDDGWVVKLPDNLSHLPPFLRRARIASLTFTPSHDPASRPGAIDITPLTETVTIHIESHCRLSLVAPEDRHAHIGFHGQGQVCKPAELIYNSLQQEAPVLPPLETAHENALLRGATCWGAREIELHILRNPNLDPARRIWALYRMALQAKESSPSFEPIIEALLKLATDAGNPPTALELRQLCQALMHLITKAKPAQVGMLLLVAWQLAQHGAFPDEITHGNWCMSVLNKAEAAAGTLGEDALATLASAIAAGSPVAGRENVAQRLAKVQDGIAARLQTVFKDKLNVASGLEKGIVDRKTRALLRDETRRASRHLSMDGQRQQMERLDAMMAELPRNAKLATEVASSLKGNILLRADACPILTPDQRQALR